MSQDIQPSRVSGVIQNYAWGMTQDEALVAKLAELNVPGSVTPASNAAPQTQKYAELWFATHPNGQSQILPATENASSEKTSVESYLGESLPFIFKVLSINQALSIQSHPDATLAKELHQKRPDIYKDPNHKPELVVALTTLDALCGFRSLKEIAMYAQHVAPFAELLSEATRKALKSIYDDQSQTSNAESDGNHSQLLQSVFREVIAFGDQAIIQKQLVELEKLVDSALSEGSSAFPEASNYGFEPNTGSYAMNGKKLTQLVKNLLQQYPGDIGCFSPFVLNCMTIQKGESLFLGPNLPHAYLSGQCIEVMACSDNVVRAGLTPKFRDVDTLLHMLEYTTVPPKVSHGEVVSKDVRLFYPPACFPEFMVFEIKKSNIDSQTEEKQSEDIVTLPILDSHSILLCTEGSLKLSVKGASDEIPFEKEINAGASWLIPRGTQVYLTRVPGSDSGFSGYVCSANEADNVLQQTANQ